MYEIEIKCRIHNIDAIQEKLLDQGFTRADMVSEEDTYYNGVDRDFRKTGEALRVRETRCEDVTRSFITYKGSRLDTVSMSRPETEVEVTDGAQMRALLMALGYRPVTPVIKDRQYYQRDEVTACVDQVQGLGDFLELEILIDESEGRCDALATIQVILESLGYSMEDTTTTSYLSMIEGHEDE